MATWENNTSIESRVGIAVEATEGTAEAEPDIELFVNEGNAPELNQIIDNKVNNKPYNEPYKRGATKGYWHVEGNLPGLKFSPTNGVPEFLTVGFGNNWYSNQVYILDVADGTKFVRGDKIFGRTSLARAEVARVVTNRLWLIGVKGTFTNSEDLLEGPGGIDYETNVAATSGFAVISGYYCHKLDAVRNWLHTDVPATLTTTKGSNKDLTFKAKVVGDAGEAISITVTETSGTHGLSVAVSGNDITVTGATTDGTGISTASEILAAMNSDASCSALVYTALATGSTGVGTFGALTHTHLTHAGTAVKVGTTATKAWLADPMIDFAEVTNPTTKKKMFVTVKDATSGTPIPISGWMGAACMYIPFDTGSAVFTIGQKLSAKTDSGTPAVIGTIVDFVVTGGTWSGTAAGYLCVSQDATARTVLDNDVLTDDNGSPGAAVANCAAIPCYLNNAVKIYNNADTSGSAQSWNGDVTTFDETDSLTYNAVQKSFDQKSMTVFVKDAGDNTKVGIGTKIKEISFDISADNFNYNVGLLGRTLKYPTIEPAYPGGLTDSAPFGALSRTFEIDGLTTGQAAQVNKAKFSATWDFAPGKGVVISENYPTNLQPTKYNIVGTLDVQWKDNALMKAFWNNPDGLEPLGGALITKRLAFLMDSGEVVTTGYNKMLSLEVMGTIDSVTLNRDQDGYIQPITIEGIMLDDEYSWGPGRFYVYDNLATHA